MDKKSNMKQAMYEMFGVGADQTEKEPAVKEEQKPASVSPVVAKTAPVTETKSNAVSYLAPGTVMEGSLRSHGDVEVAGQLKGDITTEGTVVLHSKIQGNINASNLKLCGCSLTGDVIVSGTVFVSQDSTICGNVTAKEIQCAGQITGDLKISENTALESTAQIDGSITTASISVVKGAAICGSMEIKPAAVSKK